LASQKGWLLPLLYHIPKQLALDSVEPSLVYPKVKSPFLETRVLEELRDSPPWYSVSAAQA